MGLVDKGVRGFAEADATQLVEFYDASRDVAETVDGWIENKTPIDVNAYNLLMQSVQHSLKLGQTAVHSFCPDRQYSPLMLASGTLTHRIRRPYPRQKRRSPLT